MKIIRIGQIGIGHNHGEGKMLAVRKFPDLFEVVGFSETDEKWLSARRNMKAYADLPLLPEEELLAKTDAVLVECDVWNLTKTALRCIRAGKHVHVDKPASGTVAEFSELLGESERRRLQVQMAYMYRYNPAVEKTLEMVRSGELGEIYEIVAEMSTNHNDDYRRWLGNFRGGSMYIFGSHLIDLIVAVLGEPKNVTPFILQSGKNGVFSDDNTAAVFTYDHAMARVVNSSVEMNGFGRRQFTVCGSKGTVEILPIERPTRMFLSMQPEADKKVYGEVRTPFQVPMIGDSDRYDLMMKDFALNILGETAPRYSYAHDLAVHRTILRACGCEA